MRRKEAEKRGNRVKEKERRGHKSNLSDDVAGGTRKRRERK